MNNHEELKVKKCADYIRYLALESIEKANSGHPGIALGCADFGVLLYRYFLKFNPQQPNWFNRDRFILSAGHGSILLYALLYLAGYDYSLNDLENFRQFKSKTPGHPEYNIPRGVETTTGPLGQGFANAVGCALEGKILANRFNQKDIDIVNYTVYTLMGDGCNMEGISYEAGSLAGHLGLDNLIAIYDSNDISIDGRMDITFTEDISCRYKGLGWHVENANIKDLTDVFKKLESLKKIKGKPKMLKLRTTIGEGLNNKKDSPSIHGAPAGLDEIAYFIRFSHIRQLFKDKYGEETVNDPSKLVDILKNRIQKREALLEFTEGVNFMREGMALRKESYNVWLKKLEFYKEKYPQKYNEFLKYSEFVFPKTLRENLLNYSYFNDPAEIKPAAVRGISGDVLNRCARELPQIIGGSADLTDSTKAKVQNTDYIKKIDYQGRKIFFGAREHAMGAIGNGLSLNKITIPFTSTFFTFFDYMKPAVRLAALMKLKHMFIFSHDSIFVGEDGPTHQPIEHLNSLRLIPDLYTFRPASDVETAFAFLYFLQEMNGPIAIVTTRQNLPKEIFSISLQNRGRQEMYDAFKRGAYIFYETKDTVKPDIVLSASGSEVSLALQTAMLIEKRDKKSVRVVSIPCLELFSQTNNSYRDQLFEIDQTPLVFIETASHRGVNLFYDKKVVLVDIQSFGESAPAKQVAEHFGFTPELIYNKIRKNFK